MAEEGIAVPDAPGVPGLEFRRYRGEADHPAMVEVLNRAKDEDGLERAFTVRDVALGIEALKSADPREDYVLAEVEGSLVAFGTADWRRESAGAWVFDLGGHVDPAWRRKGIGRAVLRWQERRMREAAAHIGDGAPRVFQGWASEVRIAKKALLTGEGYVPHTYIAEMVRPTLEAIPEAPLPAGLEVRPVRGEDLRAIFDAENEATREHVGHVEPREGDFERFRGAPGLDPTLWRVAWDGGEVAGMVRSFIRAKENEEYGRKRGYTEHVSVRRPWRRRGLARALVALSLRAVRERGMEEAALDVHTDNPNEALRLYEGLGFEVREMFAWYRKPMP